MNKPSKGLIGGIFFAVAIVIGLICLFMSITKVPVGYVSCIYSVNGGIEDRYLTQGWHILLPTEHTKNFTIGNEILLLTKDSRDGSEDDESFKVATSDNASIGVSFQMSYRFDQDTVVDTFRRYKGLSGSEIVDTRVRTVLKSRVSEITTDYSLMDLYSGNRAEINDKITEYLNSKFKDQFGIVVIDSSIIDVHPSNELQEAINNRVKAQQQADQAKAEQ